VFGTDSIYATFLEIKDVTFIAQAETLHRESASSQLVEAGLPELCPNSSYYVSPFNATIVDASSIGPAVFLNCINLLSVTGDNTIVEVASF